MTGSLAIIVCLASPPQAPTLPQAPDVRPAPRSAFAVASAKALKARRPLVVFVAQPARRVQGCVVVAVPVFGRGRSDKRRVVVMRPAKGELKRVATLKGTAAAAARIRGVAFPRRTTRRARRGSAAAPFAPPMMRGGGGGGGGGC